MSSARPTPIPSPTNLAWLDLEMTGLDPERDAILQAAVIVTDRELRVLDEFVCDVWQPPSTLAEMSPFVREMHEKTGLLGRVATSKTDLGSAGQQLLATIAAWCPYPATLCGNSIWQDRRFLERHLPGVARFCHYRMVDVSSVKVLAGLWYGDHAVYAKPKAGEHDALVDIKRSIAELGHYRATLFAAHRRG